MDISHRIVEWLQIMKTRPRMIIAEDLIDYKILKIYIEGYVDGVDGALNIDLRKKITLWFQNKVNQQTSVYWTDHIANFYADKTDEELKVILLDVTEDYFLNNPL